MLQAIQERTAALVAAQLRSDSVVVARLLDLIEAALGEGHAHRDIYQAIKEGRLAITWNGYRVALHRARKSSKEPREPMAAPTQPAASLPTPPARATSTVPAPPLPQASADAEPAFTGPTNTLGTFAALQRARQVATGTDFGRIARENYRARERELRQAKQKEMQ